jgi:geranylgeranyl diphosphate synthase type I
MSAIGATRGENVTADGVIALLENGRILTTPVLRAAVARLAPPMDTVASYHFGWIDQTGRPADGDGGKAVRPALALLTAEAAGAPAETGIPGAVAVELVHNFSLLHDDLIDGDEQRRHRDTAPPRRSWSATRSSRWPTRCCWSRAPRRPAGPPGG